MELSRKLNPFCQFSFAILKCTQKFEHFEKKKKKDKPHSLRILEIIGPERRGYLNVKKVLLQNTLWQSTC